MCLFTWQDINRTPNKHAPPTQERESPAQLPANPAPPPTALQLPQSSAFPGSQALKWTRPQ